MWSWGQPGPISLAVPSPQLNISEMPFVSVLQCLKPLNEVVAHSSSRRSGGLGDNGTSGGQRRTRGLQIHGQVFVGGVEARVSEPVGNRAQIHSGFEQVHRRAMPQNVGMNAFLGQRRTRVGGLPSVTLNNEPCAETGESPALTVAKQRLGFIQRQPCFVTELPDQFCRFRPQGTDALFSSFGEDLDGRGWDQPQIGCV